MTQYSLAISKQASVLTDPYYFPIVPDQSIESGNESAFMLNEHEWLIVNEGITIGAQVIAVYGHFGSNTVDCNGRIYAPIAISFSGTDSIVNVGTTGVVSGLYAGINLSSDNAAVDSSFNGSGSIVNQGTISGDYRGLELGPSSDATVNVRNSGKILSGTYGFSADDHAAIAVEGSGSTHIVNTGLIEAGLADAWSFESGPESTDTIVNTGTMIGKVDLGGGSDVLDTSRGKIVGTINGGAGDDKIAGSAFADTITGGADRDIFYFKTKPSASAVDHITDFAHGQDHVAVDDAFFKGMKGSLLSSQFHDITTQNEDANDHILYNHNTGALSYDADGAGGAKPVVFAVLDSHPALTYHDVLVV